MSAKISIRHIESITVLDVSGRITLGEGGVTLRDAIQGALERATKKLPPGHGRRLPTWTAPEWAS